MDFRVACGKFTGLSDVDWTELERPGRALLPNGIPWADGMIAARGLGGSMEPKIEDGWWLFFHLDVVGTRRDRYVLVEDNNEIGGARYTLKKYNARKVSRRDGTWEHTEIRLVSLNHEHPDIILEEGGNYEIRGWYVGHASRVERVEEFQYADADI